MDVNKFVGIANNAISVVEKVSNLGRVEAKMDALQRNMETASAKKADISLELEQEERRPGKKRKTEVHLWMQRAGWLEDQVHELGRRVRESHFLFRFMLAHQVRALATEVDKLYEKGRFDNGLTLDVKPARGYELQPGELVGQASQTKRDEIWDCLMNEEVLRVGVWGQAGVGKTLLAKHIHDQIVQDCPRFDGACLVAVSQEGTVGTIQTDIVNYLELDLTGASAVYWGARLKGALQGRKLLLILDDVGKPYSLEEVGIALERNGCKMIVTSRSREVCEQMDCHELVHVPTPPEEIPHGLEEVSKLESEGLGMLEEGRWGSEAVDEFVWGR
ncbi:disease resistance protein RFL1-like [Syzygium oleosum]|uniref:disease resistance protein RFL1-like n=1 Tax=Syzygium oleosum TaxID=219896 RepID=UPI0024BA5605|nr:disease resistance protein RFL1-like [Syzygium oleosum]